MNSLCRSYSVRTDKSELTQVLTVHDEHPKQIDYGKDDGGGAPNAHRRGLGAGEHTHLR